MVSTRSHSHVASRKHFNPVTHALETSACTPTQRVAAPRTARTRTTRERTTRELIVALTRDPNQAAAAQPVVQAHTFTDIKAYFWKEYIPSHPELIDKFREQQREQDTLLVLLKWLVKSPVRADGLEDVGRKLVDDVLFDIDTIPLEVEVWLRGS